MKSLNIFRQNPKLAPFRKRNIKLKKDFNGGNRKFTPNRSKRSINLVRNRFENTNEISSSHNSLSIELKPSVSTFRFNSRPEEKITIQDTPAPNWYFIEEVPSSLNGPRYSFSKLQRDFGCLFGEDKLYKSRKSSLNIPEVNLDKYKTETFVDISHLNERKFKKKEVDMRDFMSPKYEPTTPSYSFK